MPYGLKQTSALITSDHRTLVMDGFDRLMAFVRRARPERRDVAEHLAHLLDSSYDMPFGFERDRAARAVLTYLMRSPRLAPEYIESLGAVLFTHFERIEGTDLTVHNFDELEIALNFYLDVARQRPMLAGAHFASQLDTHVRKFSDEISWIHDLPDDLSPSDGVDHGSLRVLARELTRPVIDWDLGSLARSAAPESRSVLLFWMRVAARVARTLPKVSTHWLVRDADQLRTLLRKEEHAIAQEKEWYRKFERNQADISDWRAGRIHPGREAEHRRWVFLGKLDALQYQTYLDNQAVSSANHGGSVEYSGYDEESEHASRAKRAAEFPVGSPIHRLLTDFAGPNVQRVERGSRALPVPARLRALNQDLPDRLLFRSAPHYDEHVWERAEGRRAQSAFLKRRPPEYIVDVFERLLVELRVESPDPANARVRQGLIRDAKDILGRVRTGLAREHVETTVWSVPKRNEMLERIAEAGWTLLDGKASNPNNVLLEAEIGGTRFKLAVCVREPCGENVNVGGVATIYPVCGPGVFQVPRASKILRAIDRLDDPTPKVNKEFRQGLVSAKPCPP